MPPLLSFASSCTKCESLQGWTFRAEVLMEARNECPGDLLYYWEAQIKPPFSWTSLLGASVHGAPGLGDVLTLSQSRQSKNIRDNICQLALAVCPFGCFFITFGAAEFEGKKTQTLLEVYTGYTSFPCFLQIILTYFRYCSFFLEILIFSQVTERGCFPASLCSPKYTKQTKK